MRKTMKKLRNKKGITLIALVVTIVIILILAGITVGMVTSDNGILKETKSAKEQAEIDNEKSIVERAKMLTMMRDKSGRVTLAVFEPALKDEAGTNPTEVSDGGDTIEVLFTDTDRYYEVDKDGNVSEPQEVVKDEYAGDITKGGKCDGSEKKPYEISCIEDLVVLSNMTNGLGIKLENGQAVNVTGTKSFKGEYIILTKNLNFKSKYSYKDSQRTDFGNLNNDDTDGNALITEMTTGTGFTPISYSTGTFKGNFNGNKHTISNMYINAAEDDKKAKGLFGVIVEGYIGNLTITGNINSNWHTGGLVGEGNGSDIIIENCQNKVDIVGYNMAGGIIGYSSAIVKNCKNYGTIEITGNDYGYSGVGGIVGHQGNKQISLCENYGKIIGAPRAGGILGSAGSQEIYISNCINEGDVINNKNGSNYSTGTGGILGAQESVGKLSIINSYNKGSITGKLNEGGIIGVVSGTSWGTNLSTNIINCYNIGKVYSEGTAGGIVGRQDTVSAQNYLYIENTYNLGTTVGKQVGNVIGRIYTDSRTEVKTEVNNVYYSLNPSIGVGTLTSGEATLKSESEIKSQTFVDLLNSNIGTNAEWKRWKLGTNGYPTFSD